MPKITTYSEKVSEHSASVFWKVESGSSGHLLINLEFNSPSVEILCELVALKHLLILTDKAFGNRCTSGEGLVIMPSKGAVKKAFLGKTEKKELIKFSSFFQFIKDDLVIKTGRWKPSPDEVIFLKERTEVISADTFTFTVPEYLTEELPCLGRINISAHALERFAERTIVEAGKCNHPLRSLIGRLSNDKLKKMKLPENIVRHKTKKYGKDDSFEVWKHPTSTVNFGLVSNPSHQFPTLVTVFVKNPNE